MTKFLETYIIKLLKPNKKQKMIEVKVKKNEPVDRALKRLKKKIKDEGVLDSVRSRRYFIPKSETKKKKKQNAYYAQLMQEYKNK